MGAVRYRRKAGFLVVAAAAGLLAVAPGSEGFACGYEDPQSVSRGSLNWSYPNSLYVVGAISREVAARRLPLANFDRGGVDLFGHKFKLTMASLGQFGAMISAMSPERLQIPVAVVLVEPMLWTRFEPTVNGLRAAVHVSGPEQGDLVMITGEAVIAEIAARRLTLGQAYTRGVMRLYGEDAAVAAFVQDYQQVGESLAATEPATSDAAGTYKDGGLVRQASQYSPHTERERLSLTGEDSCRGVSNLKSPLAQQIEKTERQITH